MKFLKFFLLIFCSFIMLFGAYNHVINPSFYNDFIPNSLPKLAVNYFSALIELVVGILLIVPHLRSKGYLSFCVLMILFLPIHIWDLLKDVPAIGSKQAAIVRLIIQFVFIGLSYLAFKHEKLRNNLL